MKERIQKVLSEAGIESRRHVEEMVLQGRITVNGETVYRLPVMIDPEVDKVTVDNERVNLAKRVAKERIYIMMNKPKGVYCTNVAQGEQKRAIDLLPPDLTDRVYPVGRLDSESKGLLLLTNDGDLTQQLTHPKYGIAKTYTAIVDGFVKPEVIEKLSEGVWLADPVSGGYKTGKTMIKIIRRAERSSVLQITIKEAKNRQLRRMLARVGHKVRELTRIKMGPLSIENLQPGESRLLTVRELTQLREALRHKVEPRKEEAAPVKGGKKGLPNQLDFSKSKRPPAGRPPIGKSKIRKPRKDD